MKGLYLQGGGAKGAFQAGVIYGLYEKGFNFDIIAGTSIGAINSYFIYTNNLEALKEFWTTLMDEDVENTKDFGLVIENNKVIDCLRKLDGKNGNIKSVYVNYIEVNGCKLKEIVVDLLKLEKDEMLRVIKYSSLLPCRLTCKKSIKNIVNNFNSKKLFDEFKEDLDNGIYDGFKLDGGIVNNNFLTPFIRNKVDKLYLIVFNNRYEIPEYILRRYDKKNITVIKPVTEMKPNFTLKFEKEFCSKLFNEGYRISKNIK